MTNEQTEERLTQLKQDAEWGFGNFCIDRTEILKEIVELEKQLKEEKAE